MDAVPFSRFISIYRGPSHTYKVQRLTEFTCYSFRIQAAQMHKCYVPQNLGDELDFYQSLPDGADERNSYHLPDGTKVELTPMQRLAPEMFFSPQVFDLHVPSAEARGEF